MMTFGIMLPLNEPLYVSMNTGEVDFLFHNVEIFFTYRKKAYQRAHALLFTNIWVAQKERNTYDH